MNHDDFVVLHSCAVLDPRCDQAHAGPQHATFHRAFLLAYENALLAVDPGIEAMPYWVRATHASLLQLVVHQTGRISRSMAPL